MHESLPSTSDLLLRLAAAGEPEGLAVLAHRQTAGRGRDGRVWESQAGNLHLSLLLRPGGPAREAPQWGLLAAVALHDALAPLLPEPGRLRLKWPNDLLLGEAKLAGMLCESAADAAGGMEWLVIGLGANLAAAPQVEGRATTCLAQHAAPPSAEDFACRLLAAFEARRETLRQGGFAAIRAAWVARGPATLAPLVMRNGVAGRYQGLAEDGSLLLETNGRIHAVTSGEVN